MRPPSGSTRANVKHHTLDRLSALALKAFTTRITYLELTYDATCG